MKLLGDGIKKGCKGKFIADLKAQILSGAVTTEEQAKEVATKYLKENAESYDSTLAVSRVLPRTIKTVLQEQKFKHPYFKGLTKRILYIDIWGRVWSKTKGILKDNSELKLRFSEWSKEYSIDTLGGGMWRSKGGKIFYCEYRTEVTEFNESVNPEKFIG